MKSLVRRLFILVGLLATLAWLPACVGDADDSETENVAELGSLALRAARTAAAPTFNPTAGSYTSPVDVTLRTTTRTATIHFTVDGSNPTAQSPVYTSPIHVAANTTIKAIATAPRFLPSPVSTATYQINLPMVAPPTFNPPGGTFSGPIDVAMSTTTPGAQVFYTVDGTNPTTASTPYTAPVQVDHALSLRAIAFKTNFNPSPVTVATYSLQTAVPVFNPPGGQYTAAVDVTITSATPGAQIRFTVDGTVPTVTSPLYISPVHVDHSLTLNAIAVASGFVPSAVTTATYSIVQPTVAPVTMNPTSGQYVGPIDVTLSTTTPGAEIHYTLDGSIPTTASPVYTGPFHLTTSTTIHAVAFEAGFTPSAITVSTYQLI